MLLTLVGSRLTHNSTTHRCKCIDKFFLLSSFRLLHNFIREIYQAQALGWLRIFDSLHPKLRGAYGVSLVKKQPLGNVDYDILRFIETGELCLDGIIAIIRFIIRHCYETIEITEDGWKHLGRLEL